MSSLTDLGKMEVFITAVLCNNRLDYIHSLVVHWQVVLKYLVRYCARVLCT